MMLYLISKLVASISGRSGWCSESDAAKARSYYRR